MGRKELAQATQLSGPAVVNILDGLLEERLILDLGRRKSETERASRGQPPLSFGLNPKGAHTLGFEIGVRGISMMMLDLVGSPLRQDLLTPTDFSVETCLDVIRTEITKATAMENGPLLGIGIVVPAAFSPEHPDPATLPPGWKNVTAQELSAKLGHPVWLENDANAAALSEALFGAAAHLHSVAVIYFGEGVGLGVIQDGRLARGSRGNAGEIGHIVVVPEGKRCSCGQAGCLEQYASRHALSEALGTPLARGTVQALWQQQDPRLLGWISEAARHLAAMIQMVENMLDPESIVLSGQLPAPVLTALIEAVPLKPSVAGWPGRRLPRLQCGHAGTFSAATGAAVLPFYDVLSPQESTAPIR